MANWLQKIFGTKSDKDLKELNPILLKIQNTYPQIEKLTNDELRHKTLEFKARIEEEVKEEKARMLEIKRNLEQNYDMDVRKFICRNRTIRR